MLAAAERPEHRAAPKEAKAHAPEQQRAECTPWPRRSAALDLYRDDAAVLAAPDDDALGYRHAVPSHDPQHSLARVHGNGATVDALSPLLVIDEDRDVREVRTVRVGSANDQRRELGLDLGQPSRAVRANDPRAAPGRAVITCARAARRLPATRAAWPCSASVAQRSASSAAALPAVTGTAAGAEAGGAANFGADGLNPDATGALTATSFTLGLVLTLLAAIASGAYAVRRRARRHATRTRG